MKQTSVLNTDNNSKSQLPKKSDGSNSSKWPVKKLGDVGVIFNGNSINSKIKKDKYTDLSEGIPFIATKDVLGQGIINYDNGVKIPLYEKEKFKIAPANTPLICSEGGSAGKKVGFTNQDVCFGNKLFAVIVNNDVDSKFLFYYYFHPSFQKYFFAEMVGIIGGVSLNKFKSIPIPLPPLAEQKRIVAILDEAFEAIAKAKENTEQNLKNAKEIFESYLQGVFENKGDDWEEKKLGEVCEVIAGGDIPKGNFSKTITKNYIVPIYANGEKKDGLYGYTNIARINEPSITVSARGTIGYSVKRTDPFYPVVRLIVLTPKDKTILDLDFLLLSIKKINFTHSGTSIPQLTVPMVKDYNIPLPPLSEQKAIVQRLDALRAETQRLESIYRDKLLHLEELKKSILQKAFSGELRG
jgi:type I restriction enzyme S subunit